MQDNLGILGDIQLINNFPDEDDWDLSLEDVLSRPSKADGLTLSEIEEEVMLELEQESANE